MQASKTSNESISAFVIVTCLTVALVKHISLNATGRESNSIIVLIVWAHKKSIDSFCDINMVSIFELSAEI